MTANAKDYQDILGSKQLFSGKNILVTAGPTYEGLDPVRFIGNRSSGKMGYEIAKAFTSMGASVHLVSGPTALNPPDNISFYQVESAYQMYLRSVSLFPKIDIAILAAAVADYRPVKVFSEKIKKSGDHLTLTLERTEDIARELGKMKTRDQFVVGFALETHNEMENAKKKLTEKNFDMIILNSLQDKGAGFGHTTNKITILDRLRNKAYFSLKTKEEVAKDILAYIASFPGGPCSRSKDMDSAIV